MPMLFANGGHPSLTFHHGERCTVSFMTSHRLIFITRAGAIYDLLASAAFATPWTAQWLFAKMSALSLSGPSFPVFEEGHLLFVNLLGTLVTVWAIIRIVFPKHELLAADTIARAGFSLWMLRALALGAPRVTLLFARMDIIWLVVQGRTLWQSMKRFPTFA